MSVSASPATLPSPLVVPRITLRFLRRTWSFAPRLLVALVLPLVLLGLWQAASTYHWVSAQVLPAPLIVYQTFIDLIRSGDTTTNLWISLQRVAYGFLAGGVLGLVLGVAMGLSPTVRAYLHPTFNAFSQVPALGWIPLLMMFVGIGETLKIIIIAKAALVPVTLSVAQGIRNIPENYFEVASVFRLSRWQVIRRVVLPGALPSLFSGIRYGLTHSWLALVTVELLASSEGIGFQMVWGRQLFQLDVVLASIVVIGVVGLVFDQTLQFVEAHLLRWRRSAF